MGEGTRRVHTRDAMPCSTQHAFLRQQEMLSAKVLTSKSGKNLEPKRPFLELPSLRSLNAQAKGDWGQLRRGLGV